MHKQAHQKIHSYEKIETVVIKDTLNSTQYYLY